MVLRIPIWTASGVNFPGPTGQGSGVETGCSHAVDVSLFSRTRKSTHGSLALILWMSTPAEASRQGVGSAYCRRAGSPAGEVPCTGAACRRYW